MNGLFSTIKRSIKRNVAIRNIRKSFYTTPRCAKEIFVLFDLMNIDGSKVKMVSMKPEKVKVTADDCDRR
ncbi:MAG: hypothetical protein K5656_11140 [Lachnospiraceae bacterium]|nr:hypothetical protein [Lachnospiraceae bacterium]